MNARNPFYEFEYTHYQIKTVGWLFMMFGYNPDNPEILNPDFNERVRLFSLSLNRKQAEQNNGLALNKTARQLYRLVIKETPSYEVEHHRDSRTDWVGQIFVMLNWKFGISCEELANIDWTQVYKAGSILHETSCSNTCRKIMEKYNITPLGNDTRMRF